MENTHYSLEELCALTDLPKRTVRYYMQQGLVDRPEGATRSAHYLPRHLEQLLHIKKWQAAGLSLERIRELTDDQPPAIPAPPQKAGDIRIVSHMHILQGVTLCIDPKEAIFSTEQLRCLARGIVTLLNDIENMEKQA